MAPPAIKVSLKKPVFISSPVVVATTLANQVVSGRFHRQGLAFLEAVSFSFVGLCDELHEH